MAVITQDGVIYDNLRRHIKYQILHTFELHYTQDKLTHRMKTFYTNLYFLIYKQFVQSI